MWKQPGEGYNKANMVSKVDYGDGLIIEWGEISAFQLILFVVFGKNTDWPDILEYGS